MNKMSESLAKISDSLTKSSDSVAKSSDSPKKSPDSVAKVSDSPMKSPDSVAKVPDSVAKSSEGANDLDSKEVSKVEEKEEKPKFCQECGKPLDPDAAFCKYCGTKC